MNAERAVLQSTRWQGESAFERFNADGRFTTPDPGAFAASRCSADIDGIRIDEISSTPVAGTSEASTYEDDLLILIVREGSPAYWTPAGAVQAIPRTAHVVSGAFGFKFSSRTLLKVNRLVLPNALLPGRLRAASLSRTAPVVPSSRLVSVLSMLIDEVFDPDRGGVECAAVRAIAPLAIATAEEAIEINRPESDLRYRIIEYVDANLSDPDLSPRSIAAQFGISIRWVHHAFDKESTSVARLIRERRLDSVAVALELQRRSDDASPSSTVLAEEFGFGSRDQLARAFHTRFGVTLRDYATETAHDVGPRKVHHPSARR